MISLNTSFALPALLRPLPLFMLSVLSAAAARVERSQLRRRRASDEPSNIFDINSSSDGDANETDSIVNTLKDQLSGNSVQFFLVVACAGFLLAIFVTWTCYFLAGRRLDQVEQAVVDAAKSSQASSTRATERRKDEELEQKSSHFSVASIYSYDSRRPVSSIVVQPRTRPARAAPELPPTGESSTQADQFEGQSLGGSSMSSYIQDAKHAASTLGAGRFGFRPRKSKIKFLVDELDLAAVENKRSEYSVSESSGGFSDGVSCSSSSESSEGSYSIDRDADSEALSMYTSAFTLQAI